MSVKLRNIGHSRGVIIPKALIEQAGLENHELTFVLLDDGILIKPAKKPREGWENKISFIIQQHGHESVDAQWLDAPLNNDDFEWEWNDGEPNGEHHDK